MDNYMFLIMWIISVSITIGIVFIFSPIAQAQILPVSYYYTNPQYFTNYGYFNTIDGYLLGFAPFTPFLTPDLAYVYNSLNISTYPYLGSPYQTTFPYTTLPGTPIPYARFDYPSYSYGSSDFYLSWVLLQ